MSRLVLYVHDDCEGGLLLKNLLEQKDLPCEAIGLDEIGHELEQNHSFDLILINLCHDHAEGLNACRHLRDNFVNPILLVAPWRDEDFVLQAYGIGIDECIPSSTDPRVFFAKVNAWLRRSWTVSVAALNSLERNKIRLDPKLRQVEAANGATKKLTNLEFRVMHLLMAHPEKVLETEYIVNQVWGAGYTHDDQSVVLKNVIYRLRRKIEENPSSPSHITTIPGGGYTFHP